MKRLMLLAVAMLVLPLVASAYCGPTTISGTAPSPHDDGTGPIFNIGVNGIRWAPGYYVAAYAGENTVGANEESGYVNVLSGFGGCTRSWEYAFDRAVKLVDQNTGQVLLNTGYSGGGYVECGLHPDCQFINPPGFSYQVNLTGGHTYAFTDEIYVVVNVPGEGTYYSPIYTGTVYIQAHR